jgi:uncharacterized protein YkwD
MFFFFDVLILGVVLGLARAGWRRGFVSQAIDLVGFALAVLATVRLYPFTRIAFDLVLSEGWAAAAGGLAVFVPLIVLTAIVGAKAGRVAMLPGLHLTNRIAGIGFGAALGIAVLTFALLVIQFAPVPLWLSDAARRSPASRLLLSAGSPVAGALEGVAQRDAERIFLYLRQSLRFLDPQDPETDEDEPLHFDAAAPDELRRDPGAERELLRLVNEERTSRDLRPVRWDDRLADVGRAHSEDMYLNGYFAHRGLDGTTPAERMRAADIDFVVSGENLALAPTVALAHDGLMKSPGHRRNILDADFSKLGVGIWAGPHGLVASQEFCGGC